MSSQGSRSPSRGSGGSAQRGFPSVKHSKPINYEKVIRLLTSRHSSHLTERHAHVLRKVARHNPNGFALQNIPYITRMLSVVGERVAEGIEPECIAPLCAIVNVSTLSEQSDKVCDEVQIEGHMVEYISSIARLAALPHAELQLAVAEALQRYAQARTRPSSASTRGTIVRGGSPDVAPSPTSDRSVATSRSTAGSDTRRVKSAEHDPEATYNTHIGHKQLAFNAHVLATSKVALYLVEGVRTTTSKDAVTALLKCLRVLSENVANCKLLSTRESARLFCAILADATASVKAMGCVVEIVWNLLENDAACNSVAQFNERDTLLALCDALDRLAVNAHSTAERQLRNEVVIILSLLAQQSSTHPLFVSTGFLSHILAFATHPEIPPQGMALAASATTLATAMVNNNIREGTSAGATAAALAALVARVPMSQESEDFELKRLLFSLVMSISKEAQSWLVIGESGFVSVLFMYVCRDGDSASAAPYWNGAQFEELQLRVLSLMAVLLPSCLGEFMAVRGSFRLLEFLRWCLEPVRMASKQRQITGVLRVLLSVCDEDELSVHRELGELGAIATLLDFLRRPQIVPTSSTDLANRTDALLVLSAMCRHEPTNRELVGSDGVGVVMTYLHHDPKEASSGLGHTELLIAAVDAAWSVVVGCAENETAFLESEGAFVLLDLLEQCPHRLRNLLLGAVLDLCENSQAIEHILEWRSEREEKRAVAQLLIHLWRVEEQRIGIPLAPSGRLADIHNPLGTTLFGPPPRPASARNKITQPVIPPIPTNAAPSNANVVVPSPQGLFPGFAGSFYGMPAGLQAPQPPQPPQVTLATLTSGGSAFGPSAFGMLDGFVSHGGLRESHSVVEVSQNMRAKIYAFFCRIGFDGRHNLSTDDSVKLELIRNYLDFKVGEVWCEIGVELAREGIRPTSPDAEMIVEAAHAGEIKAQRTLERQDTLQQLQEAQDIRDEQSFYGAIRNAHGMVDKAKRDFQSFLRRTSNFEALKTAKKRQDAMIRQSRLSVDINPDAVLVDNGALHTTTFCGRRISVAAESPVRTGILANANFGAEFAARVSGDRGRASSTFSSDDEDDSDLDGLFALNKDALGLSMNSLNEEELVMRDTTRQRRESIITPLQ